MDYFAYSPFWDSKSNNNVLRTQRRIENPTYGHAEEKVELNAFRSGFEYTIAHSSPPDMFIIHKREVSPDGSRDKVAAIYWILRDKVYPTPTLYEVVSTRLKNAAFLISKTFSTLSSLHPPSNPRSSNQWRSLPPFDPTSVDSNAGSADQAQVQVQQSRGAVEGLGQIGDGDGDVDMDMGQPDFEYPQSHTRDRDDHLNGQQAQEVQAQAQAPAQAQAEPDWFLFHALNSTRASLDDLETMSKSPAPRQEDFSTTSTNSTSTSASAAGMISAKGKREGTAKSSIGTATAKTPRSIIPSIMGQPNLGGGRSPAGSRFGGGMGTPGSVTATRMRDVTASSPLTR